MPQIWGHRGLKGPLPENTMLAYREAIRQGVDGIESDVHLTLDGVVVMLHDPTLDRTTNGTGLIANQPYYGAVDQLRTTKKPHQPIPTFEELIDLLLEPQHAHINFNIDCKPTNDPLKLFQLMNLIIQSKEDWQNRLAPRLFLAVWHQDFISPAQLFMPYAKLLHLGCSISMARQHFWHLDGISLFYSAWRTKEGQALLRDCKEQGKMTIVWTVNEIEECEEVLPWDLDAYITDKPAALFVFRAAYGYDKASLRTRTSTVQAFVRACKHWMIHRKEDQWQKNLCQSSTPTSSAPSSATSDSGAESDSGHR